MVRSFTIEKTIPHAQQIKTYMYMYCSRAFNSWVFKCYSQQDFDNEK